MLDLKKELIKKPSVSFDDTYHFTSNECYTLTDLCRDHFDELSSVVPIFAIYKIELHSSRQAIAYLPEIRGAAKILSRHRPAPPVN